MIEVAPTATGSLEATPLGHLLVYALDRELTGTLVLEEPSGKKHAIYFERGGPAKAKVQEPILFLGRLLVEQRTISDEAYERTLALTIERRSLHGQVLLAEGMLNARTLREGLREQLSRQILWMFGLPPDTLFGYYEHVNFLEGWGGPGVRAKPLALIWRGVRNYAHAAHLAEVITRFGEQAIVLHADAPIRRFRFEPREQAVIDVLRAKPQPLAELLGRGLAEEAAVKRLVYALIITRQLETGVPGVEPLGVDEAPSSSRMAVASVQPPPRSSAPRPMAGSGAVRPGSAAAPRPVSGAQPLGGSSLPPDSSSLRPAPERPEHVAFRAELQDRAGRGGESYYAVLGVEPDAVASVIQGAFFVLAKKWHPDRLAAELSDVRELTTKVFARMSEAHQILSDPLRRKEYDDVLQQGGGSAEEQEQVQRVVRAATAFQKAEVLMKRSNFVAALAEANKALELDPSQADYIALLAWVEASQLNANLDEILARLEKALRMEPNNTRIHWYRGLLLKRMGKNGKAMADFRFVAEHDPRHLDAQREIRLYDMRRAEMRRTGQKSPSDRPSGGPVGTSSSSSQSGKPTDASRFGKWFKR